MRVWVLQYSHKHGEAVEMYFNHTSETHEIHDLDVYP